MNLTQDEQEVLDVILEWFLDHAEPTKDEREVIRKTRTELNWHGKS